MTTDERHMHSALALARRGRGRVSPGPLVGCVIVRGGKELGRGWYKRDGAVHAEAMALAAAGTKARGATAYVTLEPHGYESRNPPCTDALLAAGVARVVVAMIDPNPRVAKKGVRQLVRAGVAVTTGVCEDEARALNRPYIKWHRTRRPWVIVKAAITLDGRLAAAGGDARWVSGAASRKEAHRLRALADAILVGAGTVRADDPALTTRLVSGRDPRRVILDGRLAISPRARAVPDALIATTRAAPEAAARRLHARGAEVVRLGSSKGRVDLGELLDELGRRGLLTLLVEGGGDVHGQFLAAGLADEVVLFVAPKLVGRGGVPFLDVPGPRKMADAWRLGAISTRRLGDDILVRGDVLRTP